MGLPSSDRNGGTGGHREKRMSEQGRERGGIIDSPSCSKEMVDEGQVLLAFVGEGVCVEGFNGVAKFNDAYGIEALDLSEASGCCWEGYLGDIASTWVILQVL